MSVGWLSKLARSMGYDIMPARACQLEIEAAILSHLKFPHACRGEEARQEPIITLRGLPQTGIEHFFRKWFWDDVDEIWISETPLELRRVLRMETFRGPVHSSGGWVRICRLYHDTASGTTQPCKYATAVLCWAPPWKS